MSFTLILLELIQPVKLLDSYKCKDHISNVKNLSYIVLVVGDNLFDFLLWKILQIYKWYSVGRCVCFLRKKKVTESNEKSCSSIFHNWVFEFDNVNFWSEMTMQLEIPSLNFDFDIENLITFCHFFLPEKWRTFRPSVTFSWKILSFLRYLFQKNFLKYVIHYRR